jgi:hypothetical protein
MSAFGTKRTSRARSGHLSRLPDFSYFGLLETKRTTPCLGHTAYRASKAKEFCASAAECEEKANQAKDAEA